LVDENMAYEVLDETVNLYIIGVNELIETPLKGNNNIYLMYCLTTFYK